MKNLENFNLNEIDTLSAKTINGGFWINPITLARVVIYVEDAADDFVEGVKEGYKEATT